MSHKKHLKELRAKTRQSPEEEPEFQIAPMIDILLVLLVFFMSISSTEVLQTNKEVILPVAKNSMEKEKKENEGELVVNILWNEFGQEPGTVMVDEMKVSPDQLNARVNARLQQMPFLRVVIRADRNVRYDFLKTVMMSVGQAGVSNVTFAVVNKEAAPPADQPSTQ